MKKAFDLFVFSSLYIAVCAVVMTIQTGQLFNLSYPEGNYLLFVFFSTICSYNFHWYLTPKITTEQIRVKWTQEHRILHAVLFLIGTAGSVWYYFYFKTHWFWLSGAAVLTFLYSAPKITYPPFTYLRKIAIGKTIFLAFVWMYVTAFLPLVLGGKAFTPAGVLFVVNRFFFIYAICILFDYRDRINDKKEGIKSMITYFSEKGIDRLFFISMGIFLLSAIALWGIGFSLFSTIALLIPGGILWWLYPLAKRNFSDYLYYVVLDGLMMLSALIQLISYF